MFLSMFTQDIVIGTPGRLKDLIEMGVCCLTEVSFVVSRGSFESTYLLIIFLYYVAFNSQHIDTEISSVHEFLGKNL